MEKRVEQKVSTYVNEYKNSIREKAEDLGLSHGGGAQLVQYLYDYPMLTWDKDDFTRRRRVKNSIPICDRCLAKRANGEQCTRRRKEESQYCGTHFKGIPHGDYTNEEHSLNTTKVIELTVRDIGGIMYYIDNDNKVYNQAHVLENKTNPDCGGKLQEKSDGTVFIKFNN